MRHRRPPDRRGVTLLEALIAAALLAMVAASVIVPFTAAAQANAQDARQTLAIHLAEDLMEEILSKSFGDPDGTEAGEGGRGEWDDMDDYDGYDEPPGTMAGFDGAAVVDPAAAHLSRHAVVTPVHLPGQDVGQPETFVRIIVEVRYHGDPIVTLCRLAYENQ